MKKAKKNVRLSEDVTPTKYRLLLKPDLEAFVFEGEETVHVTVKKPTRTVTMHSKELDIESVRATLKKEAVVATKIAYDEEAETATFTFKEPLPKGSNELFIRFRGTLNDKMRGFYRSSFTVDGETRHLATTQFESTDARRAFPCFDEPAQKAVFEVSLVVPSDKTAISNTLPIDIKEHETGYKTVRFSPTPPMSTYLAAFIVGDFEHIEKKSDDGILVRVFTTPGKKHQARFALDCAAKTISFFNKYFDIPYPLPVVDLIAIPDFAAGAMENWGAITYRESALLVDPESSSSMNKQWVALVIAHELAHQWFGNLVTMEWWTHLWLNEGFASYIEYLAVDHIFPSWNIWTQFLHADMRPALHLDGLKHTHPIEVDVHHPSEIAAVFDAVSYSKGASIIRMLADYLGEKDFRNGLRYYLKKHSYANTETADLWNALQKVSGKPVGKIMSKWTSAAGYPLLSVSEKDGALSLSQARFFESPLSEKASRDKTLWHVPVSYVTKRGKAREQFIMSTRTARISAPADSWIKLNANESGFYRTKYSESLRARLVDAIAGNELDTRDRIGLIRDIFALSDSGKLAATDALQFASNFADETEYVIWAEVASSIANMHALVAGESFSDAFEKYACGLFTKIGSTMSWTDTPQDHMRALLRVLILGALGRYGDAGTLEKARKLFASAQKGANRIPADLRGVVYGTVARHGGAREHEVLTKMYKKSTLHEEKNRIGAALCAFPQKSLLKKTLAFSMSKDVRLQDSVRLIAGVSVNAHGSDLAWEFIKKNWGTFNERFGGTRELSHLIDPMGISASLKRATEVERFLKKNPAPGTERTLAQTLERIRSNAAWLTRERKALAAFLRT